MKTTSTYVLIFALAALLLPSPAHADGGDPTYNVTGTTTLTGTANCGHCTETVNFSFAAQFTSVDGQWSLSLASPIAWTSSGPIMFTFASLNSEDGYVGFDTNGQFSSPYDELDFKFAPSIQIAAPVIPAAFNSYFYSCLSATCASDFTRNGIPEQGTLPSDSVYALGSWTWTAVPEPSSIALLFAGLFALLQYRNWRRRWSWND